MHRRDSQREMTAIFGRTFQRIRPKGHDEPPTGGYVLLGVTSMFGLEEAVAQFMSGAIKSLQRMDEIHFAPLGNHG